MAEPIQILTAERDGEDGLLLTFSDGTVAGYVVEELLELRPFREPTESQRAGGRSGGRSPSPSRQQGLHTRWLLPGHELSAESDK